MLRFKNSPLEGKKVVAKKKDPFFLPIFTIFFSIVQTSLIFTRILIGFFLYLALLVVSRCTWTSSNMTVKYLTRHGGLYLTGLEHFLPVLARCGDYDSIFSLLWPRDRLTSHCFVGNDENFRTVNHSSRVLSCQLRLFLLLRLPMLKLYLLVWIFLDLFSYTFPDT